MGEISGNRDQWAWTDRSKKLRNPGPARTGTTYFAVRRSLSGKLYLEIFFMIFKRHTRVSLLIILRKEALL